MTAKQSATDYEWGIFGHGDSISCPDCATTVPNQQYGPPLRMLEKNYSGCSVDYGACCHCGHAFCISYAVAEVARAEDCDIMSEAERAQEAAAAIAADEAAERAAYERLRQKFEGTSETP